MDPQLLAIRLGAGVACDETGLFVGATPLLEKVNGAWRVRPKADLDRALKQVYGLPIDVTAKLAGLATVAGALSEGDIAKAQIAALHLRLPNPPRFTKSGEIELVEFAELARKLQLSGLLKFAWSSELHPRWPAGSPDSTGGQFAPRGSGGDGASTAPPGGLTTAQVDIPLEEPFPLFRPIPTPQAVPRPPGPIPPPLIGPIPRNPYPDRPECVKEWEDAWRFCRKLADAGELGKPHSWLGRTLEECMRGQVSEDCGGNPVA